MSQGYSQMQPELDSAGMQTLTILPQSGGIEAARAALTLTGDVFAKAERALHITSFMDSIFAKAASISAQAQEKPRVLFLGPDAGLSAATGDMVPTDMINVCGAVNAYAGDGAPGNFAPIELEQLLEWDPDAIWIPFGAEYSLADFTRKAQFSELSAVKSNAVYQLPGKLEPWDKPTAVCCLGIAWALNNLHGDVYSSADLKADADAFYSLLYGRTFTAAELGLR